MDTSVLEYTAEDLVAHKLQRAGILVAKPRFDQNGADLLAILQVRDGARFCRVQCKGRTLLSNGRSEVIVPISYVTSGFVIFLFVETGHSSRTHLYCFFADDLRNRFRQRDGQFVLALKGESFEAELQGFEASAERIAALKHIIPITTVDEEFRKVIFATLNVVEEEDDVFSAVVTVEPKSSRA